MYKIRLALLVIASLISNHAIEIYAQGLQSKLNKTISTFEIIYSSSFGFDQCGDSELGKSYREAVKKRFNDCLFQQQDIDEFYQNITENEDRFFKSLETYEHENHHLPDEFNGQNCKSILDSPLTKDLRFSLIDYKEGKLVVEQAIKLQCLATPSQDGPTQKEP